MFRKLLLPVAAAALMAGCMTTAPYGYRGQGQGDYYYGRPSVEYRHYDGYGYGPYHGPYRPGFYGSIRYGYPYGYGYYGRPYYGHPYGYPYYRPIYRPRPTSPQPPDTRPDGGGWRNFDELRRRREGVSVPGGSGPSPTPVAPVAPREPRFVAPEPRTEPRVRRDEGSRMGEMIRRSREGATPSSQQDE
jgi:hypothetical protein